MKEIGILFQDDMAHAIVDGRKTLTSRMRGLGKINERPDDWELCESNGGAGPDYFLFYSASGFKRTKCPYGQPGDILIGREVFYCDDCRYPDIPESERNDPRWRNCNLYYRADDEDLCVQIPECDCSSGTGKWISSMIMPWWASRLRLLVLRVWPSRLQDVTEEMAIAEGVGHGFVCNSGWPDYQQVENGVCTLTQDSAVMSYATLWDRINAKNGYPWAGNWWVWRVEFQRIKP